MPLFFYIDELFEKPGREARHIGPLPQVEKYSGVWPDSETMPGTEVVGQPLATSFSGAACVALLWASA